MADTTAPLLDRVRQPEYTGENRCVPCTVVNVVIAAVGSGAVALLSPPVGVVLFVGSLVAIYLRGYLVPGTPSLTKRYLPERIRARFDDHSVGGGLSAGEGHSTGSDDSSADDQTWETVEKIERHRENRVDPDEFLVDEGVLEPSGSGGGAGDDHLTDEFETLRDEKRDVHRDAPDDRETLADFFDVEPDAIAFEDRDYPALNIDMRIRKWPSEGALLGDVATHEALLELTDRWGEVPLEQRLETIERLRASYDACPFCDGPLERSSETVESCCGYHEVIAIACGDCGDRLREVEPDPTSAKLTRG